jgi:hypothetical protein
MKDQKKFKVSRRNFLRGMGVAAASAAVAGCDTRGTDTRSISLAPETPTPTPIPLVNQYPEVPYTPAMPPPEGVFRVLTMHEAQTVEALTARILPGTPDDPGAREAGVVHYIDYMLAFNEGFNEATYRQPPYAQIYTGDAPPVESGATVPSEAGAHGEATPEPTSAPTSVPTPSPTPTPTVTPPPPSASEITSPQAITGTALLTASVALSDVGPSDNAQSNNAPSNAGQSRSTVAYQVVWVPASEIERYGYQSILTPREVYRIGIAAVDRYANGKYNQDFVGLSEDQQDSVISDMAESKIPDFDKNLSALSFFHNLRRHTSEGMFSDPAYGGNRDLIGWKLVGYPGAQRAYEPREFQSEGTDRQPQSLMQMHRFNPGQPANPDVILPVSGSELHHANQGGN